MSMSEKREMEIERANTRFYEAFESLDIRQMEAVWASDQTVHCIHPGWDIRSGWPSVRDSWVLIFNNTAKIKLAVTDLKIVIHGKIGWVNCMEEVTQIIDEEPQITYVLTTNLYLHQQNDWLMIHHHGSPVFSRGRS